MNAFWITVQVLVAIVVFNIGLVVLIPVSLWACDRALGVIDWCKEKWGGKEEEEEEEEAPRVLVVHMPGKPENN